MKQRHCSHQLKVDMTSQCTTSFRHVKLSATSYRALQASPPEKRQPQLARRPAGIISVPGKLTSARENGGEPRTTLQTKLTKLLMNVNIDRSLGPVKVIMSPESAVTELIKAAIGIYVKEKRRPLLKETNPDRFELHYSQFSLDCLRPDEKLENLGSRSFFLCTKASASVSSSSSSPERAKTLSAMSPFPLPKLMDILL